MNEKEIRELIIQLRKQFKAKFKNKSDEEIDQMILDMFFKAYCEDELSREDLTTFTELMGYEVKEDILDEIENEKKKIKGGK